MCNHHSDYPGKHPERLCAPWPWYCTLYSVAILDLSTEGAWVSSDIVKIEELSFQYNIIMVHKIELEISIGANKLTRLGMANKITITGQAYAPSSGPPPYTRHWLY